MTTTTSDSAPLTVVLVHGAFTDASSWNGVIERLQAAGQKVTAPATRCAAFRLTRPTSRRSSSRSRDRSSPSATPTPVRSSRPPPQPRVMSSASSSSLPLRPTRASSSATLRPLPKTRSCQRLWLRCAIPLGPGPGRPGSWSSIRRSFERLSPPTSPPRRPPSWPRRSAPSRSWHFRSRAVHPLGGLSLPGQLSPPTTKLPGRTWSAPRRNAPARRSPRLTAPMSS